jgi:hypothetical protein
MVNICAAAAAAHNAAAAGKKLVDSSDDDQQTEASYEAPTPSPAVARQVRGCVCACVLVSRQGDRQ